ncbi:MAG: hypothetical protein U5J63_14120 [Fodinibius sp.]|nr:hypothetical protein [Fodinibius sp.]
MEWFYKWQPSTSILSYENLLQGFTVNRSSLPAFAESTQMTTMGAGTAV